MTNDSTGLEGRIARVLHEHWVAEPGGGTATEAWTNCTCGIRITVPGGTRDEAWRRGEAHQAEQIAAAVLPIVEAEVSKAKAEALTEAARYFAGGLHCADMRTTPEETVRDLNRRAAEYETGDQ